MLRKTLRIGGEPSDRKSKRTHQTALRRRLAKPRVGPAAGCANPERRENPTNGEVTGAVGNPPADYTGRDLKMGNRKLNYGELLELTEEEIRELDYRVNGKDWLAFLQRGIPDDVEEILVVQAVRDPLYMAAAE